MATGDLYDYASVVLNGSGNGTAKVGPISARERWTPSVISVSATTNTKEAACSIYVGASASDPYFIDASFSGSSGDSTDRGAAKTVRVGQYVFAVWTGGDAGATATVRVNGTKEI